MMMMIMVINGVHNGRPQQPGRPCDPVVSYRARKLVDGWRFTEIADIEEFSSTS
jgi:hypothetical protein